MVIGCMTYAFVYGVCDNMTGDLEQHDKVQKQFVLNFLFGLVLLCLAFTLFTHDRKISNRIIKLGFIIGSIFLLFNTIILNWHNLDSTSKTCLLCICLSIIMWYAYYIDSK